MMADVLAYIVACSICPQHAISRNQVRDWVCPACREVAPLQQMQAADRRVTNLLAAADMFPQHARAPYLVHSDDDEPDLGHIRG